MHIAYDLPAIDAKQPLQAIADDRRAQMSDMHWLRDVGAAEIEHRDFSTPSPSFFGRFRQSLQTVLQDTVLQAKIDKAGACNCSFFEQGSLIQPRLYAFGDLTRIGFRELAGCQRAVALKLREVRPVRKLNLPQLCGITFRSERGARD